MFFMSTWWGDSKNMEEIEFSRWLFEGRPRQGKNVLPDGLNWLCYFASSSKSHCENSISCIFLESPHQVDMKSIVKCWKDFLWYFSTLKTYRDLLWGSVCQWISLRIPKEIEVQNKWQYRLLGPRNFCLVAYLCIEVKKRNRQRGTCLSAFQNFCPFGYLLQIRGPDFRQFSASKPGNLLP